MLGFVMQLGTSLLAASGKACSVQERLLQFKAEVTDLLTLTNRHMRLLDPHAYTAYICSGYVTLHTTHYLLLLVVSASVLFTAAKHKGIRSKQS